MRLQRVGAYPIADIRKIYQRARHMSLAACKSTPDAITVREAAATVIGSLEARRRQIVELLQRFEGIARKMKLVIGCGDMKPREIERLRMALKAIVSLAATRLEGIPQEFRHESDETQNPEKE